MLDALLQGFRMLRRGWGLVVLLLVVNVFTAALLAGPLTSRLSADLRNTGAAARMVQGFDMPWWETWSDRQSGWIASFGPDLFGIGFAVRNQALLLRGNLPGGLFVQGQTGGGDNETEEGGDLDPVLLGLGVLYLVVQIFLMGGLLGVFRGAQGTWTVRGLLHGSGFYFGRLLRVALVGLVADGIVFALNVPFARWVDHRAAETVSESTAMAWLLGRYALLLAALFAVSMVSTCAKVIVVVEERASALLAWLSALAFCLAHLRKTAGIYLGLALLGVVLLGAWHAVDGLWSPTGYKSQVVTLLLAEALVFGRIALRLWLFASQTALYRRVGLPQGAVQGAVA
jgi:hypothetical protein